MVWVANWPRQLHSYTCTWYNIRLSVWCHQSSHCMFYTLIFCNSYFPELMQTFANGKWSFILSWNIIQPKKQYHFKFLHSCKRKSCLYNMCFAWSNIVLSSQCLYHLSTWLSWSRRSPVFFLQTWVLRLLSTLMISMPMNGNQSLVATSIRNWMEGWVSLRHVSKSVALERLHIWKLFLTC